MLHVSKQRPCMVGAPVAAPFCEGGSIGTCTCPCCISFGIKPASSWGCTPLGCSAVPVAKSSRACCSAFCMSFASRRGCIPAGTGSPAVACCAIAAFCVSSMGCCPANSSC